MSLLAIIFLIAAPELGGAARVKVHTKFASTTGVSVELGTAAEAGQILHGRFRLESLIKSSPFPPRGHHMMGGRLPMHMGDPMRQPQRQGPHFGPMHGGPSMHGGPMHGDPMIIGPMHGGPMHGGPMHGGPVMGRSTPNGWFAGPAASGGPVPAEKPGEAFPAGTTFSSGQPEPPKHLGAGAFGDVWRATDMQADREVAVKIFYRKEMTATGESQNYLTWNTADSHYQKEMDDNIKECDLTKDIIAKGRRTDPLGASRVCECYEEHITQGKTNKDSVMFLVSEMCGATDLTKFRTEMSSWPVYERLAVAREVTKQVMQALQFFSTLHPALIHHDMKGDNVVVKGDREAGFEIKVIDFGCFVYATAANQRSLQQGDPKYMPQEFSPDPMRPVAFEQPPSSFDIYGAGLIHMELICPKLELSDWYTAAHPPTPISFTNIKSKIQLRCPELSRKTDQDLALIQNLIQRSPASRLTPSAALAHQALNPTTRDRDLSGLATSSTSRSFRVGDLVEYRSSSQTLGWIKCIVKIVHRSQGLTYDVVLTGIGDGTKLREYVDPTKLRAQ